MRLLPLLTACLVALVLYGLIMERDTLRALASGPGETEVAAPDDAGPDVAAGVVQPDPPVSVIVAVSQAAPVQTGIVLSGRTEAARKVDVSAETTGVVISEPIAKGASVAAGDVLCRLDPGTRPAVLAEAEARLAEAEVNDRTASQLAQRGFSSETSAIAAQAALQGAQAMVRQAQKEIERLAIAAPFAGLLETDTAELGTFLQPGAVCGTLIALDPIRLVGFVPEREVDKLRTDSPAGGRLATGSEVRGRVSFVSRSADPLTRTFRVEVEVPNPDNTIRDGVSVEILIGLEGDSGHLLPQSALTLDDKGRLGLRLNDNGVARFAPVEIIRDDPRGVWLSGLPDRAEVIVTGQDFVDDGRAIAVTYREMTQ